MLVQSITCTGDDADVFDSYWEVASCLSYTEVVPNWRGPILRGVSEPECALPQINLLVAPQPGALHEGVYGGINQIDLLVLRWAPASFIGTEVVQLCQQLANVELLEVELDTEIVAACQHHFHVQIAGQASGLHVNPQLSLENLHGSKDHTISRAWQLQAVLAMPELRHVLGNGGCPCWWLKRTTVLLFRLDNIWIPRPAAHRRCLRCLSTAGDDPPIFPGQIGSHSIR